MSEPVEDHRELNAGEENHGHRLIAGADGAVWFDPAKQIVDLMTVPIEAAMKGYGVATCALGPNADAGALATRSWRQRFDRIEIVALTCGHPERHSSAACVHDGCQLRIDPTLGAADALRDLWAERFRAILVQLDVRAIDITQLTRRTPSDQCELPVEQPDCAPATETRMDPTPRAKWRRPVPPRHARAQNMEDCRDRGPVILGWATAAPSPHFEPRGVDFFTPSRKGSVSPP